MVKGHTTSLQDSDVEQGSEFGCPSHAPWLVGTCTRSLRISCILGDSLVPLPGTVLKDFREFSQSLMETELSTPLRVTQLPGELLGSLYNPIVQMSQLQPNSFFFGGGLKLRKKKNVTRLCIEQNQATTSVPLKSNLRITVAHKTKTLTFNYLAKRKCHSMRKIKFHKIRIRLGVWVITHCFSGSCELDSFQIA